MRQWSGDGAQRPAVIPEWASSSVGDRFFSGKWITDAARSPALATVKLPDRGAFCDDPGHWGAAMSALFRGIVLDGVPVSDPVVSEILDMLSPVVDEELAQDDDDALVEIWGSFEEQNGPLFLLGAYALVEGAWAILGLDAVDAVLTVLEKRMRDLPGGPGYAEGPDATLIAEALVRALAHEYSFEEPGDIKTLERLGSDTSGNVLVDFIDAEQVAPEDALRLGLVILAALADLARTDKESILDLGS